MRPNLLAIFLAVWTMVLLGDVAESRADQSDPRLDSLFSSLQASTTNDEEAATITREIWRAWLHSDNAEINQLMSLGIEAMTHNALSQAVVIFSRIIELAPAFAEGWNKRATVYYMMREFDRSTRDVDRTLELEPRHFGALSGQGMIYLQIDRNRAAIKFFRRALEVNPWMEGVRNSIEHLQKELDDDII